MSSPEEPMIDRRPLIALVEKVGRGLSADMVRHGRERGHDQLRLAHNAVFATLPQEGARASDMAVRAGITKQSMGEVIREMTELGLLETRPDPKDRRAKLVTYTEAGLAIANDGKRYLGSLERRFAEQFGEEAYETTRSVLEQLLEEFGTG